MNQPFRRALKLVLVEDNPGDRLIVRSFLEDDPEQQWEIVEAPNLATGIEAIVSGQGDAVLLDLHLPDGEGPDVVTRMAEVAQGVPIVVLTGSAEAAIGSACVAAGADDYVSKTTLSEHGLRRALGYAVSRRQRRQLVELRTRLESTARMAASVAHEINNPSAIIDGSMELIARRCELLRSELMRNADTPPLLRDLADGLLREIDEVVSTNRTCIERIATVVKSLGAFSRPDADAVTEVDLSQLVRHAIHLARADFRFVASVDEDLPDSTKIVGNRDKLLRMVLNLLANAVLAFPDASPESNRVLLRVSETDEGLVMSVSDNGSGMSGEVLDRAFEPFFTTRTHLDAPGLGLTICADIAHYHAGAIAARSALGEGTTVEVTLPFENGLAVPERLAPAEDLEDRRPSAPIRRILLVDDEPLLRAVTTQLLAPDFEVITAEDGVEALERLKDDDAFDAIVCDLVMPNMDGPSFYERLGDVSPELKLRIVFMTGGAYTERTRHFLAHEPVAVVHKPFRRNELLDAITQQVVTAELVDARAANADEE